MKIDGVQATTPKTAEEKKSEGLDKAAHEFEAIFVRSLLKTTPLGGKGDMYGDMAVDAMANQVTSGKGLGLGELVKRAVEKSEEALKR